MKRPYTLKFSAAGAFEAGIPGVPPRGRIVALVASHYVANLDLSRFTRSQREKSLVDVPPGVVIPCDLPFEADADNPLLRGEVSGVVPGQPASLSLVLEFP